MDYTNNYTILKDILKNEYMLVLSLLFNNFDDIIHLLKQKMPLQGEVLEYLYLSQPLFYNSTHDNVCKHFSYIDNVARTIYKNIRKQNSKRFKNEVYNICKAFHIESNEFEYYYFIAMAIIALERTINTDANELYAQIDNDIKDVLDQYLQEFLNILNKQEFQCLFYNHLEDVYENNLSIDKKVSIIHKNNYSYFLDNLNKDSLFEKYLLPVNSQRYPIIITDSYIFNVIDNKPCILEENHINNPIFDDSIRYIASYYISDMTIRNWIPFFKYFNKYNSDNVTQEMCRSFYDNYQVQYPLYDVSMVQLMNSEPFSFFDSNIDNIHYYIDHFTVYTDIEDG